MKDEEIIPFLHQLHNFTFFTRDIKFYERRLCHSNYSIVCLAVEQYEVASFIHRFLRHQIFSVQANRMGKIIKVTHMKIRMWQLHGEQEREIKWII
jgi:hypothetical protein